MMRDDHFAGYAACESLTVPDQRLKLIQLHFPWLVLGRDLRGVLCLCLCRYSLRFTRACSRIRHVWQARVTRPCRKSHLATSKLRCPNLVAESTGLLPGTALTPDTGHWSPGLVTSVTNTSVELALDLEAKYDPDTK